MALQDINFTQIIAGQAQINPGIAGWDAIINQFMADQHGRHGFGLLSRHINVNTIPVNLPGFVLITAPVGWRIFPLFIAAFGYPALNRTYEFLVQPSGEVWNPAAQMTNQDVARTLALIWPEAVVNVPPAAHAFIDGDATETFNIRINPSGATEPIDLFIYGFAWQTND